MYKDSFYYVTAEMAETKEWTKQDVREVKTGWSSCTLTL